jgi:DHA2 family multidrug resistance protein
LRWLGASGVVLLLLFLMPVAGIPLSKIQARYIISFDWLSLSAAMYISTLGLVLDMCFKSASFLRAVQVFGLELLLVTINLACYLGIASEKGNSVVGSMNFARDIGCTIETSKVSTLVARRSQDVYLAAHK